MIRWIARGAALLAALFACVGVAAAVTFTDPFGPGVCVEVSAPYEALGAPTFIGNVKCVSLCKSVASDCGKYTSLAAACQTNLASDDLDYHEKECENDPGTAQACRDDAQGIAAETRASVKLLKASELALCKAWGSACVAACQ